MLIHSHSAGEWADRTTESLTGGIAARLPSARQHVPADDVRAAVDVAVGSAADGLISIGGGSTTGLAKAVALETGLPIVAVPTTYAGSEMTDIYGITAEGRKRTGRDRKALPKTVVYDPQLSVTLPPDVTASTGMNAIAHSVEAMYAHNVSPLVELIAEESLRSLGSALPAAVASPGDLGARTTALYGSHLAGTALGAAGMAIHHSISHVLGGTWSLPHGPINSALLPHVVAFNRPAAPEAVGRVAAALNVPDAAGGLFDLASSMGAPTSLRSIGMREEDIPRAARRAAENVKWNPRAVDEAAVRAVIEAAFEGRRPSMKE